MEPTMKTILLADDEEHLRLLVQTTLSDPTYRIIEASDGPSALERARAEHPDVVVLDWMMPGMTGLEVARQLSEDPLTAGIPVVMLTARSQEKDLADARAVGVRAFLTKPFSPLELLRRVDDVMHEDGSSS
jgi:two-component system alkaline phosphatase synthesis response regulator PhoP